MSDAYWRYSDSRQQQQQQQPAVSSLTGKRPRSDYDIQSGREMPGYYPREDERPSHRTIRDTESIDASYDRYLRSGQIPYAGADSSRLPGSAMSSHHIVDSRESSDPRMGNDPRMDGDLRMSSNFRMGSDHRIANNGMDQGMPVKGQSSNLGSGRPEVSLPRDASSTLFVEGLPPNCSSREVAHIFRPFLGYKEVRLVTKDSRHPRGDPLVLCFVDFMSPPHAATAMDAIQGYKFDENDRDSAVLRLQFARNPGSKSGGGHRGKR